MTLPDVEKHLSDWPLVAMVQRNGAPYLPLAGRESIDKPIPSRDTTARTKHERSAVFESHDRWNGDCINAVKNAKKETSICC